MSADITAGVDKLTIGEDKKADKNDVFDVNWDAAVTDSWVDDNFDIDASVRDADAWVNEREEREEANDHRENVKEQKYTLSHVRKKVERRDRNTRVKQSAQDPDPADVMRGIQAKLHKHPHQGDTKRDTENPARVTPTAPAKSTKTHTRRRSDYAHTHSLPPQPPPPPQPSKTVGFRYQPPTKPRGKTADSKQTLPSMWSDPDPAPATKVNHAATREHYAAKKALWHRQQQEARKRAEATDRAPDRAPAHSHFAYSDDETPPATPATPATRADAPAPRAEPLPSMWA